MLLSMTGFSSGGVEILLKDGRKISINIEIKSLNTRFFEVASRLPGSLSFLETKISSFLKNKLVRGRIFLSITPADGDAQLEAITFSHPQVQSYISAAQKIKEEFNVSGDLTIGDVIDLPDVFISKKIEIDSSVQNQILDAIGKVADQLLKEREAEGENLEKDLKLRFGLCKNAMAKITTLYTKLIQEQKLLVTKTLELSQQGNEEAKVKLEEMYSTLNKIDVNEEIIRFESHLKNLESLLESKQVEKGKRFDFILQELMRETNTISAKCSNYEINSQAIDIKVELEKIREQVQNVL